jgi:hypothetical protein
MRQRWFSVGGFPLGQLFGLIIVIGTRNPPLRVASYVKHKLKKGKSVIALNFK